MSSSLSLAVARLWKGRLKGSCWSEEAAPKNMEENCGGVGVGRITVVYSKQVSAYQMPLFRNSATVVWSHIS